jgi:hypothetical protein
MHFKDFFDVLFVQITKYHSIIHGCTSTKCSLCKVLDLQQWTCMFGPYRTLAPVENVQSTTTRFGPDQQQNSGPMKSHSGRICCARTGNLCRRCPLFRTVHKFAKGNYQLRYLYPSVRPYGTNRLSMDGFR